MKIKNKDLYYLYVEHINKAKNVNSFETHIVNKIEELNTDDLADIIILLNKIKPNNLSKNFIHLILKKSIGFDFFLQSRVGKENFLIQSFLNLLTIKNDKIELIEMIIKNHKLYVYYNFEYIKKVLKNLKKLNEWDSKIKQIYSECFIKDKNIINLMYSDFIKKDELAAIIKKITISNSELMQNFKIMNSIIEQVDKINYNFDFKEIIKEKFEKQFQEQLDPNTEILNNMNKNGINIYADTVLNQKMSIEVFNNYSKLYIKLITINKIRKLIFFGYKKIFKSNFIEENFFNYIELVFKNKYNFNNYNKEDICIIHDSIKMFLYGNSTVVFNIIPILEKIIVNNKGELNDVLSTTIFEKEFLWFKNIYIRQSNIEEMVQKNKKINYKHEIDFFSLDIRNKFCHGLFLNKNDEECSAIYTYLFIKQILDLDDFAEKYNYIL